MSLRRTSLIVLLAIFVCLLAPTTAGYAEEPSARAILFWGETCPHCHDVIETVLPPIQAQYGEQFQLKMLETGQPANSLVYQMAVEQFAIPGQRQGVPTLIIGDSVLVGPLEIEDYLAAEIERYLAQGGVDFAALPGIEQAVGVDMCGAAPCAALETQAAPAAPAAPAPVAAPAHAADTAANVLAGAVMFGLTAVLIYAVTGAIKWLGRRPAESAPRRRQRAKSPEMDLPVWQQALLPVLALAGMAVAAYLAYAKLAHMDVICGPVGDCDAVQLSPYSELLGIPVAILGGLTYVGILFFWLLTFVRLAPIREAARLLVFGLAFIGGAFSLYLTYLEPFIIGAVCTWCLTSTSLMTIILLLATRALKETGWTQPVTASQASVGSEAL